MKKLLTSLSFFSLMILPLAAQFRFPKPEFNSGYESPVLPQPQPAADWHQYLAVGILFAVMLLTGLAVYKWRSRKFQILLILFSLAFFGFYREGCVCAIGSVQNITASLADSSFPLPLPVLAFFVLPLLVSLFFGRLFCGAACPLGAVQELVLLRPLKVPKVLDRVLRMGPPLYLGMAVLFAFTGLGFIICSYDPFVGFFRLTGTVLMLTAGVIVVALSMFVARPYCRYICPYGFLLKCAAFFSPRQVSITPDKCIKCRLCEGACPSDVIIPPKPRRYEEPGHVAVRRIQFLLVFTPGIIAAGIVAGAMLSKPAMTLDKDIVLLRNIKAGNIKNEKVAAFLATGTPVKDLVQRVAIRKQRLKTGWMVFGAWAGIVVAGSMIAASRRRNNEDYITDKLNCICCSRCYSYCPRELQGQTLEEPEIDVKNGDEINNG